MKKYDNLIVDRMGGSITGEATLNIKVECPSCGREKLFIHREKGLCHCFRCDYSANAVGLIRDVEGCSWDQAEERAARYTKGFSLPKFDGRKTAQEALLEQLVLHMSGIAYDETYEHGLELPGECVPLTKNNGGDYLYKRGYRKNHWESWGLQYCIESDEALGLDTEGHIIFPDYIPGDKYRRLRFWTTRASWEPRRGVPKSFHPPGLEKPCYGLWLVPRKQKGIIVVEGPLDAIACGAGNAVAILGSSITDAQCEEIASRFKWAVVALDSTAKVECCEVARKLKRYGVDSLVSLLDSGDPGDLIKTAIHKLKKIRGYHEGGQKTPVAAYLKRIAREYSHGLAVMVRLERHRKAAV